jgi:hypothetical protein
VADSYIPTLIATKNVPKPDGNYKGKDIEDWSWKDFQNYFDDRYSMKFNHRAPSYKTPVRSAQIKKSLGLRGNVLFKAMIDYLIDSPKRLEWNVITMNLILGNHSWAIEIAQLAQKRIGAELDLSEDEI